LRGKVDYGFGSEAKRALAEMRMVTEVAKEMGWPLEQVFGGYCHADSWKAKREERAMLLSDLARVLHACYPDVTLQAVHQLWCLTVEDQVTGLKWHELQNFYVKDGQQVVPLEVGYWESGHVPLHEAVPPETGGWGSGDAALQQAGGLDFGDVAPEHAVAVPVVGAVTTSETEVGAEAVKVTQKRKAEEEEEEVARMQKAFRRRMKEAEHNFNQVLEQKAEEIQKLQRRQLRNGCILCGEAADWTFIPCGHTMYCRHCRKKAADKDPKNSTHCGCCRLRITGGVRSILSGWD
ncbi:unnamed protein product, partial [Symbiodinium pilosum]